MKSKKDIYLKKLKNSSTAITLIALVITIVILLILAGVTIAILTGENGVINKSQEAKNANNESSIKEKVQLEVTGSIQDDLQIDRTKLLENLKNNVKEIKDIPEQDGKIILPAILSAENIKIQITTDGDVNILQKAEIGKFVEGNNGIYVDKNNKTAIIPNGFKVSEIQSENEIDNGLVIKDKMNNEFIWIPVENETDLERKPLLGDDIEIEFDSRYKEPYEKGYTDGLGTEENIEFKQMKNKVLNAKGFYFGRYEAGVDGTNTAFIDDNPTPKDGSIKPVSKKGVAPWNYTKWGDGNITDEASKNISTGVVRISKSMYGDSNIGVTSTLCYAAQYEAMCKFIGDYTRTTPKKANLEITGNVSTDISKNIYDLAGNVREWTMETNIFYGKVARGGHYNDEREIGARNGGTYPEYATEYIGFRVTLYIK